MGLVFDHVVGIVEIINCKDVKIQVCITNVPAVVPRRYRNQPDTAHSCVDLPAQVMGKVPTISINKTDGCHVYLSSDSLKCEIISAKSSEMNVLVPGKDGEFVSVLFTTFDLGSSVGPDSVPLNIPLPCFSTDGAPHS